jgi:hypothetical protein
MNQQVDLMKSCFHASRSKSYLPLPSKNNAESKYNLCAKNNKGFHLKEA